MKRLTSFLLVLAMLVSCFATMFVTTALAETTVISQGASYTTTAPNYYKWNNSIGDYGTELNELFADDGVKLTDGAKSTTGVTGNTYSAWISTPVEVVVDLGSAQNINTFKVYAAANFWGISYPRVMSVSYSDSADGVFKSLIGTVSAQQVATGESVDGGTSQLYAVTFTANYTANARYVKFTINPYGSFVWIDEVEVLYNSSIPAFTAPDGASKVHKVNLKISSGEIGVHTTLADMSEKVSGWGVYYQLQATGNTNEYKIIKKSDNPMNAMGTYSADAFITTTGFTETSGNLYMVVNGAAANPDTYNLSVDTVISFTNLTLAQGVYDVTYVTVVSEGSEDSTVTVPDNAVRVHHVDKQNRNGEISVFTSLDGLTSNITGWGMYYQLAPTSVSGEYTVAKACSNPMDTMGTYSASAFVTASGFTSVSGNIYMVISDAALNAAVYYNTVGDTFVFLNLSLVLGDYTATYVYPKAASSEGGDDSTVPDGASKVHKVNLRISSGEIGVHTTLADMAADVSGWGAYYQLRPNGIAGQYTIVKASNNPMNTMGSTYTADGFITTTGFTEVSGDLYMVVNGATVNESTYNLVAGQVLTFYNLTLVEGTYTDTYVSVGASEGGSTEGGETGGEEIIGTKYRVHRVDARANTDEISVYSSYSTLQNASINGWGVYYQLRPTSTAGRYTVVAINSNPANSGNFTFSQLGFTDRPGDIYMQVNGYTANTGVYSLNPGTRIGFDNLVLTAGEYTTTYVYVATSSELANGLINNATSEDKVVNTIANLQNVAASDVISVVSGTNKPASVYFNASGANLSAILEACIANSVLPTIRVDSASDATALINAMHQLAFYDVNVVSQTASILATVRASNNISRTGLIYNLNKSNITSKDADAIRQAVRSAPAYFVVIQSAYATKQSVSELQELGVAVWVLNNSAASTDAFNEEVTSSIASGANAVITASAAETTALINKHFNNDKSMTRVPVVVGHRGNPTQVTENTLESFISAYNNGADIFELDVYFTADNKLVIFHDYSLGTTDGLKLTTFTGTAEEGRLNNLTSTQINQYKYKTGEKIAYLDEVFTWAKGKDVRIYIEFKGNGDPRSVSLTAQMVASFDIMDQCVVISSAASYMNHTNTYFDNKMTGSYIYYPHLITSNDAYSSTDSEKEMYEILYHTLNACTPMNVNFGPLCTAVANGWLGKAATERGITLSPWGYSGASNNTIGFFSDIDTITIDDVEYFTNMVKYVSAQDILLANGQTYNGSGFTATTFGRKNATVNTDNIVYSIVSGNSVEVKDGKLVAVAEGTSKVIMGYKTKTSSDADYVLYTDVVTVTVDSDNIDILKPLIALAETMTVKDFGENDLIKLRELYAKAVNLVSTNSTDAAAIAETAIALSELLEKRYDNCVEQLPAENYTTPDPNYYKWDSSIGAPGTELHPNHIDDGVRLVDGVKSHTDISSNAYSVWQMSGTLTSVDITVNLGSAKDANIFTGYFAEYKANGISAPTSMSISYQDTSDGSWKSLTVSVESYVVGTNTSGGNLYKLVAKSDKIVNAQYVRFNVPFNGPFVWVDEVEVTCASGSQVEGDYIYVTGFNKAMGGGASVIYTNGTVSSTDIAWTTNILMEWSDFHNGYVVKSVTKGTGAENTPAVTLEEGQILLAVHDWETNVTENPVIGSAANKQKANNVKVGQILKEFGVDVENASLSLAPYVRFIDPDHVCEENGEGWTNDETHHWQKCECGEILDRDVHDGGEWFVTKPSDVDVVGKKELKCTVCGHTLDEEDIPATHAPATDDWFNNETHHWNECGCGLHLNENKHDQGQWIMVTPVGVDQEGYDELRCLTCGYLLDTRTFDALHEPATDDWKSDEDNHWKECGCGKHLEEDAHDEGVWITVTPVGVDQEGYAELRCTVCEYVLDTKTTEATHEPATDDWKSDEDSHWKECGCGKHLEEAEHDEGEWVTTKENGVDVVGNKELRCTVCGYVLDEEDIPATHEPANNGKWYSDETDHWQTCDCGKTLNLDSHEEGEWTIVKNAEIGVEGKKELRCVVCNHLLDEETIPALEEEHVCAPESGWVSDKDNHWKECACGEDLEKDSHDEGEWITTKPNGVDVVGNKELRCTVCGYVLDEEEIPATHEPANNGKWFKDETDHWQICDCGKYLNLGAHDEGVWVTTEENGVDVVGHKELRCTVCGYVLDEEDIPATHEPAIDKWISDDNNHWKECGCGKHLEEDAHDEGVWVTLIEVGVDRDGYAELRCTVCDHVLDTKTTEATHEPATNDWKSDEDNHWKECGCGKHLNEEAHDDGQWVIVTRPGLDQEGLNELRCTVCGYVLDTETLDAEHEPEEGDDGWKSDNNGHWKECSCGEHLEAGAHEGEWIIVKEAEIGVEGNKEYRCSVCGYVMDTEKIPALEEDTVKVLRGDINGNGKIDARDYLLLKRAYFDTYDLTCDEAVADINNNGKIDARDYLLLKRMYFGTYDLEKDFVYVEVKA